MQVSGVVVYSSKGCSPQEGSVFISSPELTTPEGIAFAKGHMYVARYGPPRTALKHLSGKGSIWGRFRCPCVGHQVMISMEGVVCELLRHMAI